MGDWTGQEFSQGSRRRSPNDASQRTTHMGARDRDHRSPHGNVLAAIAFLHGIACKELTVTELDTRQPGFDVTMAVRAIKN